MNGYKLQAGDVVRIQFSLYGTGLDIEGTNAYGSIYKKADKSELLKKLHILIRIQTPGFKERRRKRHIKQR